MKTLHLLTAVIGGAAVFAIVFLATSFIIPKQTKVSEVRAIQKTVDVPYIVSCFINIEINEVFESVRMPMITHYTITVFPTATTSEILYRMTHCHIMTEKEYFKKIMPMIIPLPMLPMPAPSTPDV